MAWSLKTLSVQDAAPRASTAQPPTVPAPHATHTPLHAFSASGALPAQPGPHAGPWHGSTDALPRLRWPAPALDAPCGVFNTTQQPTLFGEPAPAAAAVHAMSSGHRGGVKESIAAARGLATCSMHAQHQVVSTTHSSPAPGAPAPAPGPPGPATRAPLQWQAVMGAARAAPPQRDSDYGSESAPSTPAWSASPADTPRTRSPHTTAGRTKGGRTRLARGARAERASVTSATASLASSDDVEKHKKTKSRRKSETDAEPSPLSPPSPKSEAAVCMLCNRTLASRGNLLRHLRTHSGERPYACDQCGQRFNDNSNRMKHQNACRHVGAPPPRPQQFAIPLVPPRDTPVSDASCMHRHAFTPAPFTSERWVPSGGFPLAQFPGEFLPVTSSVAHAVFTPPPPPPHTYHATATSDSNVLLRQVIAALVNHSEPTPNGVWDGYLE